MSDRVIIIGDIHGCLEEFDELIKTLAYNANTDRVVLAGDLVDKGPDSVGVVRRARELKLESVLGNHEEKHIRRWRWDLKVRKGEAKTNPMKPPKADEQVIQAGLSDEDFQWLESLPLYLRLNSKYAVVHGGCEPGRPLERQSKQIVRVRYVNASGTFVGSPPGIQPPGTRYWSEVWTGPESLLYGHAVHDLYRPRVDEHSGYACYGIDTGCVFGGRLTAAVLQDSKPVEYVSVPAKKKYSERLVDSAE